MPEAKPRILIVEDDLDVAEMLNAYFRVQGYEVTHAEGGEAAVEAALGRTPDIILLDIRLPDIDGYEVAKRLRTNWRSKEIPIIFLTDKRARQDRLRGFELGADDYITKPFDIQELRLRVRNALRRSSEGAHTNPITNLPEGSLLDEKLAECLAMEDWALLLISLENLDEFREAYGFVASDDVLRAVSLMIHNADLEIGLPDDFIGQWKTAQFLLVTKQEAMPALRERINARLEQSLDYFYPLKDRGREKGLAIGIRVFTARQGFFKDLRSLKMAIEGRAP